MITKNGENRLTASRVVLGERRQDKNKRSRKRGGNSQECNSTVQCSILISYLPVVSIYGLAQRCCKLLLCL